MARTGVKSSQVRDGSISREDLNTTESSKAVIAKIIPGANLLASSSGPDIGTGDVTLLAEARFTGPEILIPYYHYPYSSGWTPTFVTFVDMIKKYNTVRVNVIVNPASGPGTIADIVYTRAIKILKGAGARVLGYVSTAYTTRAENLINADIGLWRDIYPEVDGIFLDETPTTYTTFYDTIVKYARQKSFYPIIGNPGAPPDATFFTSKTMDALVVFETSTFPVEADLKGGDWENSYMELDYKQRALLLYNISSLTTLQINLIKKYCGYIFVTNLVTDYWNGQGGYFERLLQNLSGSVSGENTYIQYNDNGSLGASLDFTFENGNLKLGQLNGEGKLSLFASNVEPVAEPDELLVYSKSIASRLVPKFIGPSGLDTAIQPMLAFNNIRHVGPGGATTATTVYTAFNTGYTNAASSYAQKIPSTGSIFGRLRAGLLTSAATAGSLASHRSTQYECSRETGFFYVIRFYFGTLQTGNRSFIGLWNSNAAATNVDPLSSTARQAIGIGFNADTGNMRFITSAATTPTVIDLGTNFPVAINTPYELVLFSAPSGSSIGYRIKNLNTDIATSGSVSSNIPLLTTNLAVQVWICNNVTAAAVSVGINKWYLETDY